MMTTIVWVMGARAESENCHSRSAQRRIVLLRYVAIPPPPHSVVLRCWAHQNMFGRSTRCSSLVKTFRDGFGVLMLCQFSCHQLQRTLHHPAYVTNHPPHSAHSVNAKRGTSRNSRSRFGSCTRWRITSRPFNPRTTR